MQAFEIYSHLSQSRIDGLEQIIQIYTKTQNDFLTLKFDLFDFNDQQFENFYNQLNEILSNIDVNENLLLYFICSIELSFSLNCMKSSIKISIEFFVLLHTIPTMP